MSPEPGYCYVVLFSNGFAKGGKSRDIFKRYKAHKASSSAYGISVKRTFYTAPHFAYDDSEKRLLSALSEVSEGRIGEYFRGVTEDAALEVLSTLGLEVSSIEEYILGIPRYVFEYLARDPDLTGETWQILSYLFSKLDFENDIHIAQKDIAEALNMRKQHVSRAMKLLCDKQIVLKGPQVGRSSTYHLNAYYGWKGKVKNLQEARKTGLTVIDGGKAQPPTEQPGP